VKNVLVTGGAGFIGSNFVHHLFQKVPGVRVFVIDIFTYAGHGESLSDLERQSAEASLNVAQLDICDQEIMLKYMIQRGIDTVVHFAAESHVDRSIHGPEAFVRTNVLGTCALLEAARHAWAGVDPERVRFHHISTDEVYGSLAWVDDPPFTEKTPYDPSSPYSATKAAADHLVRAYHRTYKLPVTISNSSNNYGPFQHPEKLVPLMILNSLLGRELPVYGDGLQRRDWLYVGDHCDAILAILERGRVGETYNVGGGAEISNRHMVEMIADVVDEKRPDPELAPRRGLIRNVADRPGHDRRYAIDHSKITKELGWTPKHSLQDGIRSTVDWYLSNAPWLKAVLEKDGDFAKWTQKNYRER
jgi:dTDP-glucose 4,6-dehydratase